MDTKPNWKKNIAVFMSSQAISLFGSSLVQYAITWYITLTTGSGIYAMLSIICGFLPAFFLSPFAGVWADRHNKKWLIALSDGAIALCTLILAIINILGYQAIWLLLVASAIRSLGSAIQTPAVSAVLPSIVPQKSLARVNGLNESLQSVITLLSPVASGAIMGLLAIEYIFFIDVITAVVAIALMFTAFRIPDDATQNEKTEKPAYFDDLKSGLSYIKNKKWLKQFFVYTAIFNFLVTPAAILTQLQITRNFGSEVWRLTLAESIFSVGMLAGGLIITAWGGFKNRMSTICTCTLAIGLCTLALSLPVSFPIYIITLAVFGMILPMFNIPATTILQEQVSQGYMGRIFGVLTMINSSMMPLGMMLFGPLADIIAIEWLLLGSGLAIVLVCIRMYAEKSLWRIGRKKPKQQMATVSAGH